MIQKLNNSTTSGSGDHAKTLLSKHGVSRRSIARQLNISDFTVGRVLNRDVCHHVTHGTVLRVRRHIEGLLLGCGWTGNSEELWAEYDKPQPVKVAA